MNPLEIIDKYYEDGSECKRILLIHSRLVADKALSMAAKHPELNLDTEFIGEASLIHDIGIFLCDAPSIGCNGNEPYIRHGILGAAIMRREGFERHALVCERHTGAGLTAQNIVDQQLPLPIQDFTPQTLEEKIVCFADKFFSKTHPEREKSLEKARKSILRFDEDSILRFDEWCKLFL